MLHPRRRARPARTGRPAARYCMRVSPALRPGRPRGPTGRPGRRTLACRGRTTAAWRASPPAWGRFCLGEGVGVGRGGEWNEGTGCGRMEGALRPHNRSMEGISTSWGAFGGVEKGRPPVGGGEWKGGRAVSGERRWPRRVGAVPSRRRAWAIHTYLMRHIWAWARRTRRTSLKASWLVHCPLNSRPYCLHRAPPPNRHTQTCQATDAVRRSAPRSVHHSS